MSEVKRKRSPLDSDNDADNVVHVKSSRKKKAAVADTADLTMTVDLGNTVNYTDDEGVRERTPRNSMISRSDQVTPEKFAQREVQDTRNADNEKEVEARVGLGWGGFRSAGDEHRLSNERDANRYYFRLLSTKTTTTKADGKKLLIMLGNLLKGGDKQLKIFVGDGPRYYNALKLQGQSCYSVPKQIVKIANVSHEYVMSFIQGRDGHVDDFRKERDVEEIPKTVVEKSYPLGDMFDKKIDTTQSAVRFHNATFLCIQDERTMVYSSCAAVGCIKGTTQVEEKYICRAPGQGAHSLDIFVPQYKLLVEFTDDIGVIEVNNTGITRRTLVTRVFKDDVCKLLRIAACANLKGVEKGMSLAEINSIAKAALVEASRGTVKQVFTFDYRGDPEGLGGVANRFERNS